MGFATGLLSNFAASVFGFGALPLNGGAGLGALLAVAGSMRSRIGAHAVSAGTRSNVDRVTSQTRWREPADALCIDSVTPSATSRMSVALTSSISIETLESLMTKLEKEIIGVISRSDERVECCCEGA